MFADNEKAVLCVIAEKVITRLSVVIGGHFGYLFFYKTNIKNLEKEVVQLENLRDDVESFFKEERWNNVERAESSAGWLKDVEEVTMAAKQVVAAKDKSRGWCLSLKNRYGLRKKSTKLVAVIRELHDQAPKRGVIHPTLPERMLHGSSSNNASKDYKSRTEIMDTVMEALKDDKLNIIGVYGLGGIGKTTILHEVCERARTQRLFDEVAMIRVSQVANVFKIQKNLAGILGLTRIQQVDDIIARADLLHKRLTNGSTVLVVIDDIWSEIRLEEVGIPIGNGWSRCKVVLVSRNESVCASMKTQKTIHVDVLSKKEAWDMFTKAAGDCIEREKLERIAKEVVDECGGLPIALLTLARALSNKKKRAWEDARRQLRQSSVTRIPEMNQKVYSSIMLSYNFLASVLPEAQLLLLICCQYRDNDEIEVEKLVRYCLALELFKNVDKLTDARNITYTLIDHLKSCFLLQVVDVDEEGMYERVKMHDVVREICLSIVSEVKEERDKVYMHIMSQDTSGGHELGTSNEIDYSKLKILIEVNLRDSGLQQLGELRMKDMRVLEICQSGEHRYPQPALHVLENLRMLSSEGQFLSKDIMSMVGKLSRLEILSIWHSTFLSFPCQLGQLSNLKLLDLRGSRSEEGVFPSGILPRLNKLEVLCMGSFFLLGAGVDKDVKNGETFGCIKELESLSFLTTLQIELVDPNDLQDLQCLRFKNMETFLFFFKEVNRHTELEFGERQRLLVGKTIHFIGVVGMKCVLEANIQFIVRSTLALRLENNNEWTDPLILKKFVSLNELTLKQCNQLKYIIPEGSLDKLRILKLEEMSNMRRLLMGPIDPLCLVNLREIEISECEAIETIFPHTTAKCLIQLQILKIHSCCKLVGIFSKVESGTTSSSAAEFRKEPLNDFIVLFPKLRILSLHYLSELKGFYNLNIDDGKVLRPFINPRVMLPSLEMLNCSEVDHVKQMVGGGLLEHSKLVACDWLQNLQVVRVSYCDSLETLFDFEGLHFMGENVSGLKYIDLCQLPKLEHLFWQIPQGIHFFQNLQTLEVDFCTSLGYLISSSMAHMLVNLKSLIVKRCESMKEVIKMDEGYGVMKIRFRFLSSVKLENLKNLSSFCSDDRQSIEFPSLEEVTIYNCVEMKTFCCGHLTTEKLHGVNPNADDGDIRVWNSDLNETIRHLNERPHQAVI